MPMIDMYHTQWLTVIVHINVLDSLFKLDVYAKFDISRGFYLQPRISRVGMLVANLTTRENIYLRSGAWMRLVYAILVLLDREFNHSRKCLACPASCEKISPSDSNVIFQITICDAPKIKVYIFFLRLQGYIPCSNWYGRDWAEARYFLLQLSLPQPKWKEFSKSYLQQNFCKCTKHMKTLFAKTDQSIFVILRYLWLKSLKYIPVAEILPKQTFCI